MGNERDAIRVQSCCNSSIQGKKGDGRETSNKGLGVVYGLGFSR